VKFSLVGELVRVKAYALALVYLQASEYTAQPAFANVFGKTSQAVLKEFPSLETVAAMPFKVLRYRGGPGCSSSSSHPH